MEVTQLSGVITALVTPFSNGELDEVALVRLVERQIAAGVDGLLVGSHAFGEAATLSPQEIRRLIELCVETVAGRIAVIADASSNSTLTAMGLLRQAKDLGADAALVSVPWYNRPAQEGIVRHFEAVTWASDLPIFLGNAPQRAALEIQEPALSRLAALPTIIGIEEASGDITRVSKIRNCCGTGFQVLHARDGAGLAALAFGAHALTSLTANLLPEAMVQMVTAWRAGHPAIATRVQDELFELHRLLTLEPTPSATKMALAHIGLCRADVRLPLVPPGASTSSDVVAAVGRAASIFGPAV
jgi:4-hydroxy-tetrahydrodipicolinate synthase